MISSSSGGWGGGHPCRRRRRRLFRIRCWSRRLLILISSLVGACFFCAYLNRGLLISLYSRAALKWQSRSGNVSFRYRFPESWRPDQLMVDLPGKCQIPSIDPYREDMRPWVKILPKLNCNGSSSSRPRVSYVQDNNIHLDLKLLNDSSAEVSCCYKSIHRISQSLENYNASADNGFYYSKGCEPMSSVHPTIPHSMFVKVECKRKLNSSNSSATKNGTVLLYQKFHAVALLPPPPPPPRPVPNDTTEAKEINATRSSRVGAIVDFWEECSKQLLHPGNVEGLKERKMMKQSLCAGFRTPPPNILLLGIDSTSRLNFRRHMSRTAAFLTRIGAVEMLGYSAVGDNTFPNLVPLFMSLSDKDLRSTCERNSSDSLDDCPLIWKDFSSSNYLTAHLEDLPSIQIFNNGRIGFVHPPVDIYLRPFMQALYEKGWSYPHCDGYESLEELTLNFAVDLMTSAAAQHVPTFISTWMTDLTHDDPNGLQKLDDLFYDALWKLEQVGTLSNTIVLVVGDHGNRYLPSRNTLSGHFEVRLPALWIHLPETIRKSNVDWMPNLLLNRRILATPYDVHATLHHILTSVNSNSTYKDLSNETETTTETPEWGRLKEPKGKSLFRPLPHRTCEEAHIPQGFCSCAPPVQYDDTEMILIAANAAVEGYINRLRPASLCSPLAVSTVFSSGLIRGDLKQQQQPPWSLPPSAEKPHQMGDALVLGIDVNPGEMKFEVVMAFDKDSAAFTKVALLLRTNSIAGGNTIGCLKGDFFRWRFICNCRAAG